MRTKAITLAVLFLFGSITYLTSAQSAQDAGVAPAPDEREFKNNVPGHVPLKVKIKNEKSFKDRGNKKWARELEIEVKNTGDKPIYFLYFVLTLRDVVREGHPFGFRLIYGRKELWLRETEITPDDAPILPGESITMAIPETFVKGYEAGRDAEGRPDPQKVEFDLQAVDFGDGTAFRGTDGARERRAPKKVSANDPRPQPRAISENAAPPPPSGTARNGCSPQPATFSRVNFF